MIIYINLMSIVTLCSIFKNESAIMTEWDEAEKKANRKVDTCLCEIKYIT